MTYESGETVTLNAKITRDLIDTLDGITVTVSVKEAATGVLLLSNVLMEADLANSTTELKEYNYVLDIPKTLSGTLCWWVTVESASGYKTIAKTSIEVVSTC